MAVGRQNQINWSRIVKYASTESNIFNGSNFNDLKQKFSEIAEAMCQGNTWSFCLNMDVICFRYYNLLIFLKFFL